MERLLRSEHSGPGSDASPASAIPYNRLYIGALNFSLTEQDIESVFTPFGPVDMCELHKDPSTDKSKGYGFVQCGSFFCLDKCW